MPNRVSFDLTTLTRATQLIGTAWSLFRPRGLKIKEAAESVLAAVQKSHQGQVKHLHGEDGLNECCRIAHDLMRENRVFQRDDGGLDHDQEYIQTPSNHRLNCEVLYFLGNTVYNQLRVSEALNKSPDLIPLPQRAEGYDWKHWMKTPEPWPTVEESRITLEGLVLSEILQAWRDVYGNQNSNYRWPNIAICVLNQVYMNAETFEEIYDLNKFKWICYSIHSGMCLEGLWEEETQQFFQARTFSELPTIRQEKIVLLATAAISAISDFVNPDVK